MSHGVVSLAVAVYDPLWFTSRVNYKTAAQEITSWEHEIAADGGYKSAKFTIRSSQDSIDDWIERGLGRHIELYDQIGIKRWEGFVNQINAQIGALTITRGPLMNVANRVLVAYTPIIDVTVDPPTTGTQTETLIAEDTVSQGRYSILETIYSGGQLMDATTITGGTAANEANEVRDAYLAEYKNPETNQSLSFDNASEPTVNIDCLGYEAYLDKYVYNSSATGYTTVPLKIPTVLAAQPNTLFSTDIKHIADSAPFLLLTENTEDQNKTARQVINEMVAKGTSNDTRTLFGIYNDRIAYYDVIPSTIEYVHYLTESGWQVQRYQSSTTVYPWEVLPGKWIHVSGILTAKPQTSELRTDPRNIFIESVRYTAPYGLSLTGSRVTRVKQLLAKKGIGV